MHIKKLADPFNTSPADLQRHQASEPPALVLGQAIKELLGLLAPIGIVQPSGGISAHAPLSTACSTSWSYFLESPYLDLSNCYLLREKEAV